MNKQGERFMHNDKEIYSRRSFLKGVGTLGLLAAMERLVPAYARTGDGLPADQITRRAGEPIDLFIADQKIDINGRTANAITISGSLPGPVLRLKEGEDAVIRVTNRLKETSSIHWHGLLVPQDMDGVPGVSFAGIKPGETFVYKFPVKQYGTYWFHSHSGGQELLGVYAPMIIDPIEPEPFQYDRDYIVMLSDFSFENPMRLISNLKALGNFYNFKRRTVGDFFRDASNKGLTTALSDYEMWSRMRMDPTDTADVSSYTLHYLMNGLSPKSNWTGLFKAGERVRLRFINAGASTYFDCRIPGLKMTVVEADGQYVQPVEVDEFRIAPAETFDVIVEPSEDRAYTVFAETMDRSGYARGTLAPRAGMTAEIPKQRPRPILSMKEMGMDMSGMDMGGMQMGGKKTGNQKNEMPGMEMGGKKSDSSMPGMKMPQPTPSPTPKMDNMQMPGMEMKPKADSKTGNMQMPGMNMPGMQMNGMTESEIPGSTPVPHSKDSHGVGNQTVPMTTQARLDDPGIGLGADGWRVLVYTDLRSLKMREDVRAPEREIELHITGNMERYMWSFDGKKYSQAKEPIPFRYGERLRLTFVNDTMMSHPLHLHGMWMELENGHGHFIPRKHTVSVKPAERVSVAVTVDAPLGEWAFHCHLLLHMEMGMFRVIRVTEGPAAEVTK
jgi:CopA family copper-resistance protein